MDRALYSGDVPAVEELLAASGWRSIPWQTAPINMGAPSLSYLASSPSEEASRLLDRIEGVTAARLQELKPTLGKTELSIYSPQNNAWNQTMRWDSFPEMVIHSNASIEEKLRRLSWFSRVGGVQWTQGRCVSRRLLAKVLQAELLPWIRQSNFRNEPGCLDQASPDDTEFETVARNPSAADKLTAYFEAGFTEGLDRWIAHCALGRGRGSCRYVDLLQNADPESVLSALLQVSNRGDERDSSYGERIALWKRIFPDAVLNSANVLYGWLLSNAGPDTWAQLLALGVTVEDFQPSGADLDHLVFKVLKYTDGWFSDLMHLMNREFLARLLERTWELEIARRWDTQHRGEPRFRLPYDLRTPFFSKFKTLGIQFENPKGKIESLAQNGWRFIDRRYPSSIERPGTLAHLLYYGVQLGFWPQLGFDHGGRSTAFYFAEQAAAASRIDRDVVGSWAMAPIQANVFRPNGLEANGRTLISAFLKELRDRSIELPWSLKDWLESTPNSGSWVQADFDGANPIFWATSESVIRELIHLGWSATTKTAEGNTPLHSLAGAFTGRFRDTHRIRGVVYALITAGVSLDAVDLNGHTAIDLAAQRSDYDFVRALCLAGAQHWRCQ